MAPSMLNEMHKNLYVPHSSMHGFPKPLESSSKLREAMIDHLNKVIPVLHQRMLNHCQQDLLLEIISVNHLVLIHFVKASRALSSNYDFL